MPIRPPEIPTAGWIVDRRHLENTLNHDLSSLSLSSLHTATSHPSGGSAGTSFMSYSSIEGGRAFGQGETALFDYPSQPSQPSQAQGRSGWDERDLDRLQRQQGQQGHQGQQHQQQYRPSGPSGTPRAAHANANLNANANAASRRISTASAMSFAESPKSTEGHHVSAMTLADGVFRRHGNGDYEDADASEFDPERSLGKLVGGLGRKMGNEIAPRPISPFTHVHSPPRSPSPLPSLASKDNGLNLSYTLSRADALPSPPDSRGSHSSGGHAAAPHHSKSTGFTSMARQLQAELGPGPTRPKSISTPRRALSDSTTFNVIQPTPPRSIKSAQPKPKQPIIRTHVSAPTRGKRADLTADITGMTGLMATPAKGGAFDTLGKNGDVGNEVGDSIPQTLATLHARLRALETEGSLARRRVRELEGELERARAEVHSAQQEGGSKLQEAAGEKSALKALVASLRDHLARLTNELDINKRLVLELQSDQAKRAAQPPTPPRPGTANELELLRREIERLSREITRLSGIVEEGLDARRRSREERTVRIEEAVDVDAPERSTRRNGNGNGNGSRRAPEMTTLIEIDEDDTPFVNVMPEPEPELQREDAALPSRLRQGIHTAAATSPTLMPPSAAPSTRVQAPTRRSTATPPPTATNPAPTDQRASPRGNHSESSSSSGKSRSKSRRPREGPASPFPSIRVEDEDEFFTGDVNDDAGGATRRSVRGQEDKIASKARRDVNSGGHKLTRMGDKTRAQSPVLSPMPPSLQEIPGANAPQTVLARVIAELEDDYTHYRSIYAELADQYRLMSATSAANKRQILAQHLKDVIDTLEHKSGQIHALYSLLSFQDRPDDGVVRGSVGGQTGAKTPRDVMRMVRETLGEEAVQRLEEDGVCTGARRRHCVV